MACYLDPRLNKFLDSEEKDQAEKELLNKFTAKNKTNMPTTQSVFSRNDSNKKLNVFERFALECGNEIDLSEKNYKSLTIKDEISLYNTSIIQPKKFRIFWQSHEKQLPLMASYAREICISTATSVPSESSFSIANYVQRKERSNLSSYNLRYSMVLRDYWKLKSFLEES